MKKKIFLTFLVVLNSGICFGADIEKKVPKQSAWSWLGSFAREYVPGATYILGERPLAEILTKAKEYEQAGKFDLAEKEYRQGLIQNPYDFEILKSLVEVLKKLGKKDSEIEKKFLNISVLEEYLSQAATILPGKLTVSFYKNALKMIELDNYRYLLKFAESIFAKSFNRSLVWPFDEGGKSRLEDKKDLLRVLKQTLINFLNRIKNENQTKKLIRQALIKTVMALATLYQEDNEMMLAAYELKTIEKEMKLTSEFEQTEYEIYKAMLEEMKKNKSKDPKTLLKIEKQALEKLLNSTENARIGERIKKALVLATIKLARMHIENSNLKEALEEVNSITRYTGSILDNMELYILRAQIYEKLKSWENALRTYENILLADLKNKNIYLLLAKLFPSVNKILQNQLIDRLKLLAKQLPTQEEKLWSQAYLIHLLILAGLEKDAEKFVEEMYKNDSNWGKSEPSKFVLEMLKNNFMLLVKLESLKSMYLPGSFTATSSSNL